MQYFSKIISAITQFFFAEFANFRVLTEKIKSEFFSTRGLT